jgi:hypothetical protein
MTRTDRLYPSFLPTVLLVVLRQIESARQLARTRRTSMLSPAMPPLPFAETATMSLPAALSFSPKADRTPALQAVSQICRDPVEPATAIVDGSSGQKEEEKTLPYASKYQSMTRQTAARRTTPRSLEATSEMVAFSPVPTFHSLTILSVPPVTSMPSKPGQ